MSVERMSGTKNVLLFPRRPPVLVSLEALYDLRPDVREVHLAAEAYGLDLPAWNVRDEADRAMAEYIVNHVRPEPGMARRREPDLLLLPFLKRAIEACRQAKSSGIVACEVFRRLELGRQGRALPEAGLEDQAFHQGEETARLFVAAHIASEEALGIARAVDFAKRGELWEPLDLRKEEALLFQRPVGQGVKLQSGHDQPPDGPGCNVI